MPEIPFHEFNTAGAMMMSLADEVGRTLSRAADARGAASLVVPGGATPQLFFEKLRAQPSPWSQVQITLTDERWIPVKDKGSNERMVRTTLMAKGVPAAKARLVGFKNAAHDAEEGAEAAERELMRMPRPFDAVIIGMGEDGHIASLFPGVDPLWLDPKGRVGCEASRTPEGGWRVTQTVAALLTGEYVALLVTGQKKHNVIEQALQQGPAGGLPVASLLCQERKKIEIWWAPN